MTLRARMPRIKTSEPNLYLVGDVYYYRKDDRERALGRFPSLKKAIEYKNIFEQKRDSLGPLAYKFKVKDLWPDYFEHRTNQANGAIKGRRAFSDRSLYEIDSIWHLHLKKAFANKRLSEVDDPLWTDYCDRATVTDLTNHRKVLKYFLKWCKLKGHLRDLPIMEIPKVTRRIRPILKPDQIKALISNSSGNVLLFVAMYLLMGIRWGEQIKLQWSSIDLAHGSMRVLSNTSRTRKGRAIMVNAFVLKLLNQRLKEFQSRGVETDWVFPMRGRSGEHMSVTGIMNPWRVANKNAGLADLKLRPHDLRATYEYYANKRADFTDTQREKMAGASIEVQRARYVTFDAEDVKGLEEVVTFDGLDAIFKSKIETTLLDGNKKQHGVITGMTENLRKKK